MLDRTTRVHGTREAIRERDGQSYLRAARGGIPRWVKAFHAKDGVEGLKREDSDDAGLETDSEPSICLAPKKIW